MKAKKAMNARKKIVKQKAWAVIERYGELAEGVSESNGCRCAHSSHSGTDALGVYADESTARNNLNSTESIYPFHLKVFPITLTYILPPKGVSRKKKSKKA